jgi:hypothetical protein
VFKKIYIKKVTGYKTEPENYKINKIENLDVGIDLQKNEAARYKISYKTLDYTFPCFLICAASLISCETEGYGLYPYYVALGSGLGTVCSIIRGALIGDKLEKPSRTR